MTHPTRTNPRAIVLLSGGMDSCVCAALAAAITMPPRLHVSYGQRTETASGNPSLQFAIASTSKTSSSFATTPSAPSAAPPSPTKTLPCPSRPRADHDIPVTYVPFRNAHFLSVAVSWAEVLGAEKIYIGAVEPDSSGYPDCRPAYYEAFNRVIRAGTKEGNIEIVTPLIAMRKAEIVRLGLELNAPLDLTWSCYQPVRIEPAAVCDSCCIALAGVRGCGSQRPDSLCHGGESLSDL